MKMTHSDYEYAAYLTQKYRHLEVEKATMQYRLRNLDKFMSAETLRAYFRNIRQYRGALHMLRLGKDVTKTQTPRFLYQNTHIVAIGPVEVIKDFTDIGYTCTFGGFVYWQVIAFYTRYSISEIKPEKSELALKTPAFGSSNSAASLESLRCQK